MTTLARAFRTMSRGIAVRGRAAHGGATPARRSWAGAGRGIPMDGPAIYRNRRFDCTKRANCRARSRLNAGASGRARARPLFITARICVWSGHGGGWCRRRRGVGAAGPCIRRTRRRVESANKAGQIGREFPAASRWSGFDIAVGLPGWIGCPTSSAFKGTSIYWSELLRGAGTTLAFVAGGFGISGGCRSLLKSPKRCRTVA